MKPKAAVTLGLAALLVLFPGGVFSATVSAGCGGDGWHSETRTIRHGGITRTFRVHLPSGYETDVPAPLVVYFHGWGGNEDEFIGNESVRDEADRRGYILLAPRGLGAGEPDQGNNSWTFSGSASGLDGNSEAICDAASPGGTTPDYRYPSCVEKGVAANTCSWTQCQQNDVEFVAALLAESNRNLCVDTGRVYAMGGSNGGMFTWELAQNRQTGPLLNAIAPVIGLPHRGYLDPPARPDMPAIVITGLQDDTVPPGAWDDPGFTTTSNGDDRFYYTGATAITRVWARANGCAFETGALARPFDAGMREADCRTYCYGGSAWPKVLDCRSMMGHDYGLPWSWTLILDFFDEHSKR